MDFIKVDLLTADKSSLLKAIEENCKRNKILKEEIVALQKVAEELKSKRIDTKTSNYSNTGYSASNTRTDFTLEEEFNYYFSTFNNLTVANIDEMLLDALPSPKNERYIDLLYRMKMEVIKNIKAIKDYIKTESNPEEAASLFQEELFLNDQKLEILNSKIQEFKSSEEFIPSENVCNKLIFAQTPAGNIRVLEELAKIPHEYYENFYELFMSIKNGTFKNIKKFDNNNNFSKVSEVKGFKTRVVFARLSSDTYVLITAFIKTQFNDAGYRATLGTKVADYRLQEPKLKANLENEEFLKLNSDYEEELFRLLSSNKTLETASDNSFQLTKKNAVGGVSFMELLNKIQSIQAHLEEKINEQDPEILRYKSFLDKIDITQIASLMNCDFLELAILYMRCENPGVELEKITEYVKSNKELYKKIKFPDCKKLFDALYEIIRWKGFSGAKLLFAKEGFETQDITSKDKSIAAMNKIKLILKVNRIKDINYDNLIELYKINGVSFFRTVLLSAILRAVAQKYGTDFYKLKKAGVPNIAAQAIETVSNLSFNVEAIYEFTSSIEKYYKKLCNKDKVQKSKYAKTLDVYRKLEINISKALESGEIANAHSLLYNVDGDDIYLEALKVIYEHNLSIYSKTQEEYEILSQNASYKYQALLTSIGINIDDVSLANIMKNSYNAVFEIIGILNRLNIKDPLFIKDILQTTDLKTITTLKPYIEKDIAYKLKNNLNLYDPSSQEYNNFLENMAFINRRVLDRNIFSNSEKALIASPDLIKNNTKVLEDYSLIRIINSKVPCDFLTSNTLASDIDTLLELGYENNLEENIEVLNYCEKLARLKVLKLLDACPQTSEELMAVLSDDNFIIPDDKIEDYLYNATDYCSKINNTISPEHTISVEEPKTLKSFSNTSRTYNINGVLISKNRILRNLSVFNHPSPSAEELLSSVLSSAFLTEEELTIVSTTLVLAQPKVLLKEPTKNSVNNSNE